MDIGLLLRLLNWPVRFVVWLIRGAYDYLTEDGRAGTSDGSDDAP